LPLKSSIFQLNKNNDMMVLKYVQQFLILSILIFVMHGKASGQSNLEKDTTNNAEALSNKDTTKISDLQIYREGGQLWFKSDNADVAGVNINGEMVYLSSLNGRVNISEKFDEGGRLVYVKSDAAQRLYHISSDAPGEYRLVNIPLWMTLIPPVLAIILALIFKEVLISLFLGIWSGAFIAGGFRIDSVFYLLKSFWDVVAVYVVDSLSESGHISVLVFSFLIGGMVAVISKNGGMVGVVDKLSAYATTKTSVQFTTWFLGVIIFFDDYANTLIVGNAMRPVTDKFKVSREKLSYLVDSTAAPVASIAFVTTWIGAELGYIDSAFSGLDFAAEATPYTIFFNSLSYAFYPILTLVFMLMIILMKRDFGPMYRAELRAHFGKVKPDDDDTDEKIDTANLNPVKNAKPRWYNAGIPVILVVLVTILALLQTGFAQLFTRLNVDNTGFSWSYTWSNLELLLPPDETGFFNKLGLVIGASDSYVALIWASLSGLLTAVVMTLSARIMKLEQTMHWVLEGFKTMFSALIILVLAWSLAEVTKQLHTAGYISMALQGKIDPVWMPPIIFVLAAVISFSTGSSWSTMAILYPIAIPATYGVCMSAGMDEATMWPFLYNVVATVLAASVLGDHCSPISDTTILSSMASDCNHLDHVKTQMPYALVVGLTAVICVALSSFLGGGILINISLFLIAVAVLYFVIRYAGKMVEQSQ